MTPVKDQIHKSSIQTTLYVHVSIMFRTLTPFADETDFINSDIILYKVLNPTPLNLMFLNRYILIYFLSQIQVISIHLCDFTRFVTGDCSILTLLNEKYILSLNSCFFYRTPLHNVKDRICRVFSFQKTTTVNQVCIKRSHKLGVLVESGRL